MQETFDPQLVAGLPVRIIIHGKSSGALNMAIDEVLMESSAVDAGRVAIRLYGFAPATVSVGRFQKVGGTIDIHALREDGVDFVRRPTGGQAVYHDGELTYSVAIGNHHIDTPGKRSVYRMIVPLLTTCLSSLGVRGALMRGEQRGPVENPDCFASSGEYEIDGPAGEKLIGSAQAVTRSSVLQHGSIPLDSSNRLLGKYLLTPTPIDHTPTHVSDIIGKPVGFLEAQNAFAMGLKAGLLDLVGDRAAEETQDSVQAHYIVDELADFEKKRVEELATEKYASDEWNLKY